MKYLIMLVGIMLMFSCATKTDSKTIYPYNILDTNNVITVEGCEYFVVYAYWSYTFVHKGNCKNPIHIYNKVKTVKTNIIVIEE